MNIFKLIGTIAINNSGANDAIDNTTQKASESSGKIVNAFKKIGGAVVTYFAVDKIKDFGTSCIDASANAEAMASQFTQVFGDMEATASGNLDAIADNTGVAVNRMKGSYTKIAAFAKTTGMETADALSLADRAMIAVADSAAFYDRSLEETTESLQSFLKGNYENDSALGLSCTEVTRNTAAMELYGKSFQELSEAQKQLTLLQMVEDANATSGALGQASRESETWANQTGNLKQAWTDMQAELGKPILSTAVGIVSKLATNISNLTQKMKSGENPIKKLITKFKEFSNWLKDIASYTKDTFSPAFETLVTVLSPVIEGFKSVIDFLSEYVTSGDAARDATNLLKDAIFYLSEVADVVVGAIKAISDWCVANKPLLEDIALVVGSFAAAWVAVNAAIGIYHGAITLATTLTTAFSTAIAFITSPIGIAVAAIGGIIAVIVLLVKHWDEVSAAAKSCWDKIVGVFSSAADWLNNTVVQPVAGFFGKMWSGLTDGAKSAWDGICSVFSNVAGFFGDIFSAAWQKVVSVFSVAGEIFVDIKDGIVSAFKTIVNALIKGINKVVGAPFKGINKMLNTIRNVKILDFKPFSGLWDNDPISVPEIPMLESGAVLEKGQVGYLEGNGAEAVVPLEKNKKWLRALNEDMQKELGLGNNEAILRKLDKLIEVIQALRIYLYGDVLVGELAPAMDAALGDISYNAERGL